MIKFDKNSNNENTLNRQQSIETQEDVDAHHEDQKLPIVYSRRYVVRFWYLEKLHPFDAAKGKHIFKNLEREQLLMAGNFYEPREITTAELLKVHTRKYLKSLEWSYNAARISEILPLIFVPNVFVQRGYLRPMRFQAAGSVMASYLALRHGWAINLGGGFHHCCSYQGGGFCPYADISLLIMRMLENEKTVQRIMIIDLDAHQGNGHERDFLDNEQVFILDMYNASIYPLDHPAKLAIRCAVELQPHTGDQKYLSKLRRCLTRSLEEFPPDFVVYNAGTDILVGDPLGLLAITPKGVMERDEFVFATCRKQKIPIVMLLSGGYLRSSAKVVSDSIMNLKHKGLLVY